MVSSNFSHPILGIRRCLLFFFQLTLIKALSLSHSPTKKDGQGPASYRKSHNGTSSQTNTQYEFHNNLTLASSKDLENSNISRIISGAQWNYTSSPTLTNSSSNSSSIINDGDEDKNSHKKRKTQSASSYAFIITMLSITVIMATIFTLFGLFVKAEAHGDEHHDPHGVERGHHGFHPSIMGFDDAGDFMKGINPDIE